MEKRRKSCSAAKRESKSEGVEASGSKQLPLKTEYTCSICNWKFDVHNDLLKHFLKHGNNEIDFRGLPKSKLKMEKKRINPAARTTMIQCEWCTDKFADISRAIQHKHRKHPDAKTTYYCEFCGKLFPLRISLIQHQLSCDKSNGQVESTPAPMFQCKICEAKFISMAAKMSHERNTHFASIPTTIVPPPSKKIRLINSGEWCSLYYCHLCGSEYAMKHNLRKHLENHHSETERTKFPSEGIIKCKLCDAIFHTKNAYEVHNLHHTKDDITVRSEEERLRRVGKVDQDADMHSIQIPPTIKLTSKGKVPDKYRHFMPAVQVNLTPISTKNSSPERSRNK
ncbi:zinc finger protein 623-like [Phlebotomus argentipes]|uniref:zinc finger protein 623-like n=1 Tax=Phlebotomus argentipes TaxID=94469 RepID=UPI002893054E|nr:zinc finger protein 623-like [Phlebotomus argentipes]